MAALQNEALDNLEASKKAMSDQNYSYMKAIPDPANMGVGSEGSFGQVAQNVNAASDYVNILGFGDEAYGDSYFLNTGGTCVSPSGTLENRYNYIDNRPSYKPVIGRSLISGVLDDVGGMNPLQLFKAVKSSGTPACQKYKCNVTNLVNGDTQYMSPYLSPDFSEERCKFIPEPADPDASVQAKINSLSARVTELQSLVASNPDNDALKSQLTDQQNELSDLLQSKLDMANRRKEYPILAKETFELMSSPLTGGLLVAGVLLATLVFRRYL